MASVQSRLVRHDAGLVLLFTPPFDRTAHDPGYIKGYPPGIRENGGQYTHAATWTVIAQAILGHGTEAAKLFSLLNPISHTSSRADVQRYKVEPYVVAADVYSVAPHVGRGGWTWYTGSAELDVPRGSRVDPGIPGAGGETSCDAVHPRGLAAASKSSSGTPPRVTRSWSKTRTGSAAASLGSNWTA